MKNKTGFEKFFTEKKKPSMIKEEARQEKRKWKKERYERRPKSEIRSSKFGLTTNYKPATSNLVMPLNKYIAHSGICSRRDAVEIIKSGNVKVNNEIIREPGHRISSNDKVRFKLALSLHAANDKKRNEIMPINESNNLKSLVDALNYFYIQTKKRDHF